MTEAIDRSQAVRAPAGVEAALRASEAWLEALNEAFRAAIDGAPLEETLGVLARAAAERLPGARCAFYVFDRDNRELRHVVGMTDAAAATARFQIGLESLAYGLAVETAQPVITPDVREEPRWKDWLWLAERNDYRACWSFPVEAATGYAVGSLEIHFAAPREATRPDRAFAEKVTRAAAVIIAGRREAERRARVEAALRANEARQAVLLAELQHRVRNILGVVRGVVRRTADGAEDVESLEMHLDGRLAALARTQVMLTRAADAHVDLEMLVRDELLAQALDCARVTVEGPPTALGQKAAEVLTLAVHELATNAVKYGAVEAGGGIQVLWDVAQDNAGRRLVLRWSETGATLDPSQPRRSGFGTELIERRIPYELKGRGALTFRPDGVDCEIEFPLADGESAFSTMRPATQD